MAWEFFTFYHITIPRDPIQKNKQKIVLDFFRKISKVNYHAHLEHKYPGHFSHSFIFHFHTVQFEDISKNIFFKFFEKYLRSRPPGAQIPWTFFTFFHFPLPYGSIRRYKQKKNSIFFEKFQR